MRARLERLEELLRQAPAQTKAEIAGRPYAIPWQCTPLRAARTSPTLGRARAFGVTVPVDAVPR